MVIIYPTVHLSVQSISFLSIKPTQWMYSYMSIQSRLHLILCVLNHSFTHPLTYLCVCSFAYLSLDFNTTAQPLISLSIHEPIYPST